MKKKNDEWDISKFEWKKVDEKAARKAGQIKFNVRVAERTALDTYISVVDLPMGAVIQGWTPRGDADGYYFGQIHLSPAAIEKVIPALQKWLKKRQAKKPVK